MPIDSVLSQFQFESHLVIYKDVDAVPRHMMSTPCHVEQSVPASARCHGASIGPSSSRLQAARHHAQRRGGALPVSAQVAEPSASSRQLLEALFVADSRDAPWLSTSLAWHRSIAEQAVTQLAVQLDDPPDAIKEREERRKRQEFYANVGDAIRTLREEIPLLFVQDFTYEIYRDDVVFKDPRNTVKGKGNYRRLFRFVRVLGRIVFNRVSVRVQRIWQLDDRCISVRWEVSGRPRIPWEVEGVFDGVSYFKLDKEGKIYEHLVDNVVLRDPPMGISPLWTNLQRILNPQPVPCPGLRCQDGNALSPARQLPEALVGRLALAIVSSATAGLLLQSKSPTYGARHMEPGSGMN